MKDHKKFTPQEEFSIEFGDVNGIKLFEVLNKSRNEQGKKQDRSKKDTKD
ncbi:MAG: hypothetical protein Q8934_14115 [Bacillota bacterium]|nr:hypothetical protein [Bacillota bacterium]